MASVARVLQRANGCLHVNHIVGMVRLTGPRRVENNYWDELPRDENGEWALLITRVPNAMRIGLYIRKIAEESREEVVERLVVQSKAIARSLFRAGVDYDTLGNDNVIVDQERGQLYAVDLNTFVERGVTEDSFVRRFEKYVRNQCWALIKQDRRDEERRWGNMSQDQLLHWSTIH